MSGLIKKLILTTSSFTAFISFIPKTEALQQQAIKITNPNLLAQTQAQSIKYNNNRQEYPLELLEQYIHENSMSQVNLVDRLRDVSPTNWAYKALVNLVERYGCIVGFEDSTYRGNQTLSRYEFAGSLNSCLSKIEELLNTSADISREEIDTLLRLMQEFQTE